MFDDERSPRGQPGPPAASGLYDPQHEHDACGVGFVVDIKGRKSHAIVRQALQVLKNLAHRGACGCEVNTGDGAGILIQTPDAFLRKVVPFTLPAAGEWVITVDSRFCETRMKPLVLTAEAAKNAQS